jgi:hypothetical protein
MIVKKVNRYYCEYCKKANCSASSISQHEKHCTLNPNRECGMCNKYPETFLDPPGVPLKKLIVSLPDPKIYLSVKLGEPISGTAMTREANAVLPKIREMSNNCPACILAALRQRGIPVPLVTDFNFKEESEKIFAEELQAETNADFRAEMYQ